MAKVGTVQNRCFPYLMAAIVALLSLSPVAAHAAAKTSWDVVTVKSGDGAFGFCRAETLDPATGFKLAVALSPSGETNLGIKVPDGGFKKGETFPLTITIDGTAFVKSTTAEAGLPELLLIRMGQEPALLAALSKGTALIAKGESDETRFSLAGGDKMVATLKSCVVDGTAASKTSGKASPADVGVAKPAGGLPAGLASLLAQAKLNVTPLTTDAPKSATAVDESWTVAVNGVTLDGGFREMRVKPEQDFTKLTKATIEALKGQCKAGLKVDGGKAETFPQLTMTTYDLTCGAEFVGLVAYRTETGIYGQLLHRAATRDKSAAITARDRLAGVIRQLGMGVQEPSKAGK